MKRGQPEDYHITRYRPRTEGLFARIEKWVDKNTPAGIHWRATTKDNITSIYGKTVQARIFDPENQAHTYEWLLEETFDAKGNHILFEYAKENKGVEQHHIYETNRSYESQRYIRRIFYGNAPEGVKVGFNREGTDHLENYASNNELVSRHYLLKSCLTTPFWRKTKNPPTQFPRNTRLRKQSKAGLSAMIRFRPSGLVLKFGLCAAVKGCLCFIILRNWVLPPLW